jgi:hypothetical protein
VPCTGQSVVPPRLISASPRCGNRELKLAGYKVVFMKPKFPVTTLPEYDELIMKQMKVSGGESRPTSSIVRTISE